MFEVREHSLSSPIYTIFFVSAQIGFLTCGSGDWARLLGEVTEKNGVLRKDLVVDLDKIRKEFSLDNEDGVLSRLVARVEGANRTILNEFSADNELSALNKMAKLGLKYKQSCG